MPPPRRIIVIDPCDATRVVLARRLRAQGYVVEEASDPAAGADLALCAPPAAVVADLWMPGISGVQLCRLLRSEPGTAGVAVVLVGEADDPRDRFWADRAGANAYVPKRSTGELVRALARTTVHRRSEDAFFLQLAREGSDIRDRIARHLDAALFASVLAAEVRALATSEGFEPLFDRLVQFLSQVAKYRWLALRTEVPNRVAVHHRPGAGAAPEGELRGLGWDLGPDGPAFVIEDEDAAVGEPGRAAITAPIQFAGQLVGEIAVSPASQADAVAVTDLVNLVSAELGGSLRMALLVEESRRLAATDSLTGVLNRRALHEGLSLELARSRRYGHPLAVAVFDVDHFKKINDGYGHEAGDRVLAAIGEHLQASLRRTDLPARWGGEEFVVAFLSTPESGARIAAERLRAGLEALVVVDAEGRRLPLTVSVGVALWRPEDDVTSLITRADVAMYASKRAGRNRVSFESSGRPSAIAEAAAPDVQPIRISDSEIRMAGSRMEEMSRATR